MANFTKHLFGCFLMALVLVVIFAVLVPTLLSNLPSVWASLGFGAFIMMAIGAVYLIRHTLGLDMHSHNKE